MGFQLWDNPRQSNHQFGSCSPVHIKNHQDLPNRCEMLSPRSSHPIFFMVQFACPWCFSCWFSRPQQITSTTTTVIPDLVASCAALSSEIRRFLQAMHGWWTYRSPNPPGCASGPNSSCHGNGWWVWCTAHSRCKYWVHKPSVKKEPKAPIFEDFWIRNDRPNKVVQHNQ